MISVLFVCLGNICRSPMAETVFNKMIEDKNLATEFMVDSAGLYDFHQGEKADIRMREHAEKRGYVISHLSRPIKMNDFEKFDFIVGMDEQNIKSLQRMAKTSENQAKIHKITDFLKKEQAENVPDPYYGGNAGFEYVIDLLEDACEGLLEHIHSTQS